MYATQRRRDLRTTLCPRCGRTLPYRALRVHLIRAYPEMSQRERSDALVDGLRMATVGAV